MGFSLKLKIVSASTLFVAACSSGGSVFQPFDPNSPNIERVTPQYEVEVETIEQQAMSAVNEMPLEFSVDYTKNSEVWERSKLFFLQYTKGAVKGELPNAGLFLTNQNSKDRFLYTISQRAGAEGMTYTVQCAERGRGETSEAVMNARNTARFIRDGKLELKYLLR